MALFLLLAVSVDAKAKEHYYTYNKNHQGYSITEGHDPNTIVVAGSSCNNPQDCKIFAQATDKTTGNILWRHEYNLNSSSERCFKILKVQYGYLLTGYTSIGDHRYTFVMEIDNSGTLVWSRKYNDRTSVGLSLHECSDYSGYIIAGYMATSDGILIEDPSMDKEGFVMKVHSTMSGGNPGNIIWNMTYNSARQTEDYDMAEDITEIPGNVVQQQGLGTDLCYYITGSVNLGTDVYYNQKVLSLIIDDNGSVVWNNSFATSGSQNQEAGASSIYNPSDNYIYLLSNSTDAHGFYISKIDPFNGTIIMHNSVHAKLIDTVCKLAGYQIINKNQDSISVIGFVHNYDFNVLKRNPTFSVDISKSSLSPDSVNVFDIPSDYHNLYFNGWLGLPDTIRYYPRIHTPDLAYVDNNNKIHIVCYKKGAASASSTDYDLATLHLNFSSYNGACDPMIYEPETNIAATEHIPLFYAQHIFMDYITLSATEPIFDTFSCDSGEPVITASYKPTTVFSVSTTEDNNWGIYPNPAKDKIFIKRATLPSISENITVTILNSIGQTAGILYEGNAELINSNTEFSLPDLPEGVYYINISSSFKELYTQQLIIKK